MNFDRHINYWACLILSAIWQTSEKPHAEGIAIFWFCLGLFFIIFRNKNENT